MVLIDAPPATHDGMRDPAGLVFCVVGIQTDSFADHAIEWT